MSQGTPHNTTIGEHDYTMFMLPPMQSHRLLVQVVQMVGPSLGPVVDMFYSAASSDKDLLDQEVTPEFFTKAAGALFGDLNEKVLNRVLNELKVVTVVENVGKLDKVFDVHFLGRLDEMYKWLAWGMQVQWGKVWSGLAAAAQEKIAAAVAAKKAKEEAEEKASQSPTT